MVFIAVSTALQDAEKDQSGRVRVRAHERELFLLIVFLFVYYF